MTNTAWKKIKKEDINIIFDKDNSVLKKITKLINSPT